MKIGDRVQHNGFGTGTIVYIRHSTFKYLVKFDFEEYNLIWVRERDIEKVKVLKYVRR